MAKDIAKEAIEEAKKVKASAMSNARQAMAEAFTPIVRDTVSKALNEELGGGGDPPSNYDEDGEQKRKGDNLPAVGETGEDQSDEGDGPAIIENGLEEDEFYEEDEDEFGDDEFEDDMGGDDFGEDPVDDLGGDDFGDEDMDMGGDDMDMDYEEDEDDVIEVVEGEDAIEGEDALESDCEEVDESEELAQENRRIKKANRRLALENRKLTKVVSRLKDTLTEVNLFNTKLKASMALFKNVSLTNEEKERVIDRLDECATVGEIKRTYSVMKEAYTSKSNRRQRASRPNQKKASQANTELNETTSRWGELAGLL